MDHKIVPCGGGRYILVAQNYKKELEKVSIFNRFDKVIEDVTRVYSNAILVGAVAASKYLRHPIEPRLTQDVDIILDTKDYEEFLMDEIPEDKCKLLDRLFDDSDSANHSVKHKATGIYVDFLSSESMPLRKKTINYILQNREKATNVFQSGDHKIDILKPEFIIAMKLNRYGKHPRSERGLSDRLDIIKMLKALWQGEISINHDTVEAFLNKNEINKYTAILNDVKSEMCE